jgi:hypothetical protein
MIQRHVGVEEDVSLDAMLLLQFLHQDGGLVEIRRQLSRSAQRIRDRRPARLAFMPVAGHHTQLLRDDVRQRGLPCLLLLLHEAENVGIQIDRQSRAHAPEQSRSSPDDSSLGESGDDPRQKIRLPDSEGLKARQMLMIRVHSHLSSRRRVSGLERSECLTLCLAA